MATRVKTLILQKGNKKRIVKIRERKNLPDALEACASISRHCKMPIKQIRYK